MRLLFICGFFVKGKGIWGILNEGRAGGGGFHTTLHAQ